MPVDAERLDMIVSGRVQGVFYRHSTLAEAQRLGLVGAVRNLPDGAVEVIAEGPREKLDELLAWCRHGPPMARVDDVIVKRGLAKGEFRTFQVER
ncbi:MAG TPA: acylphosphatase [Myxococcales bacterium]|nr:acylphosphatase [Myxococcales bacterium]